LERDTEMTQEEKKEPKAVHSFTVSRAENGWILEVQEHLDGHFYPVRNLVAKDRADVVAIVATILDEAVR